MRYDEEDEDEGPKADPTVEQGMPLPIRLNAVFPPELTAVPIEDIDPYYRNQRVSSTVCKHCSVLNQQFNQISTFLLVGSSDRVSD